VRERDLNIVKEKRRQVIAETGSLRCTVCSFDFFATYGELGRDFCEVHHLLPMSLRHEETQTLLQDLAIVCSNCHRMLHRKGLLSIEALQQRVHGDFADPAAHTDNPK
jgi:5-methylcytosine-specific restriction protein A